MNKKITRSNLQKMVQKLREQNKKIVFTNGCFDILHPGHVAYLNKAKSFGDVLIVGVNSDMSVKNLKGKNRPIVDWNDRTRVLEGLEAVDYIVKLSENTPIELIRKIKPDVHVKGGDYKKQDLPEYGTVTKNGGVVKIVKFLPGFSTTRVIEKILKSEKRLKGSLLANK